MCSMTQNHLRLKGPTMTTNTPVRITADSIVDEVDGWRFDWFEQDKKRKHVQALDSILGSTETADVMLRQIEVWRQDSFGPADAGAHVRRLDEILAKADALVNYPQLIANAHTIAMKGVSVDDGHSYMVPASDLVAYQKTILALIDAVSDLTSDAN